MALTQQTLTDIAALPPVKRKAAIAALGRQEWAECAKDPLYWMDASRHANVPYVYTHDPHPMHECTICKANGESHVVTFSKRTDHLKAYHNVVVDNALKLGSMFNQLPATRPFTIMPYMPPIINTWLEHPFMVFQKSRDMMATWLIVTLYTWDTLFHEGRQNIFQSEDATKTLELVNRSYFIWRNQPKFLRDVLDAKFSKGESKSGILRLDSINSEILGFPQGGDQIRQYHPSGLFADEAAFQVSAGDAFAAVKPALQNGGRYTAVSTPNPSYFMLLCQDRSDEDM